MGSTAEQPPRRRLPEGAQRVHVPAVHDVLRHEHTLPGGAAEVALLPPTAGETPATGVLLRLRGPRGELALLGEEGTAGLAAIGRRRRLRAHRLARRILGPHSRRHPVGARTLTTTPHHTHAVTAQDRRCTTMRGAPTASTRQRRAARRTALSLAQAARSARKTGGGSAAVV